MTGRPSQLWTGYRSRAATFENPSAAPSAGGTAADGRKGAPMRPIGPGERVVLADLAGPGTITHVWLTVGGTAPPQLPPATLRAQVLEVFYDDLDEPSISVPAPDFFGAAHGVPVPYSSSVTAVNEGRGFTGRLPLPFRDRARVEYENASDELVILYYQVDALFGPLADDDGYLHATFRRENPTTPTRDFVIVDGVRGPGRYVGAVIGVRTSDPTRWWGEGEVKVYLDGEDRPTICGTGTEDYVDSAWGLGRFAATESGAPLVAARGGGSADANSGHDLVSLYRWHLADPVVFERELAVTVQQIGMASFTADERDVYEDFKRDHAVAGGGWLEGDFLPPPITALGLYERSDDWCATAFVYLAEPQPVPRLDVAGAVADLPTLAELEGLRTVRRAAGGAVLGPPVAQPSGDE